MIRFESRMNEVLDLFMNDIKIKITLPLCLGSCSIEKLKLVVSGSLIKFYFILLPFMNERSLD